MRSVVNALDEPLLDTVARRLRQRESIDLRAIAEKSPFYRVRPQAVGAGRGLAWSVCPDGVVICRAGRSVGSANCVQQCIALPLECIEHSDPLPSPNLSLLRHAHAAARTGVHAVVQLAPTLSQPAECHAHARHGHRCSRAEPLAPPPPPLQTDRTGAARNGVCLPQAIESAAAASSTSARARGSEAGSAGAAATRKAAEGESSHTRARPKPASADDPPQARPACLGPPPARPQRILSTRTAACVAP